MQMVCHMIKFFLLLEVSFLARALGVSKAVDSLGVHVSSELRLPAQWSQVALVYAGHHYRIGPAKLCISKDDRTPCKAEFKTSVWNPRFKFGTRHSTDWRTAKDNHHDLLVGPLAKRGITVDVYLHSWPSHKSMEADLVEYYKPVRYKIANTSSYDAAGVDSRVEALKLIAAPERYDAILLTRFDLLLFKPLDAFPIQPSKINVPFREISELAFRQDCRVSDLMMIFPPKYLGLFTNGSWALGHALITNNPLVDKAKTDYFGCPHWQEHINLMSWEYAESGDYRFTPIGVISRDLATVEDGPYYFEGIPFARYPDHSAIPKA